MAEATKGPKPTEGQPESFMGSLYKTFIVHYKQDIILEKKFHLCTFIQFNFLVDCFVTIATGFVQNPGQDTVNQIHTFIECAESRPGPPLTGHSQNIML